MAFVNTFMRKKWGKTLQIGLPSPLFYINCICEALNQYQKSIDPMIRIELRTHGQMMEEPLKINGVEVNIQKRKTFIKSEYKFAISKSIMILKLINHSLFY